MDRRNFIRAVAASGGAMALGGSWSMLSSTAAGASDGPYGTLLAANTDGLRLPAGFSSRVVATTGQVVPTVPGTAPYTWHGWPDGGATFPTPGGGWIYVSNSELGSSGGGVGAIEFDSSGTVVEARSILTGTSRNCAGGPTPWGTWLSCEEVSNGQVWECDPTGTSPAIARPEMGRFNHEAAAVDPVREVVYLTEDRGDGLLYRFVPASYPDLSSGTLEALIQKGKGSLKWSVVADPSAASTATRQQVKNAVRFNGGEGAWFHDGVLWFTTKGDGRVWTYDASSNSLDVAYDDSTATENSLTNVDNVTVAASSGDVFVAEDGGNMEIAILTGNGADPFVQVTGVSGSEMTGPAFSPDGSRLYFSSQRSPGQTFEVTGPFRTVGPPPTTTTTTTTTAPGGFALSASGRKVKGLHTVDLSWTGASGGSVVVERNGTTVNTVANDGSHTDDIGVKGKATYSYRLLDGATPSNTVVVTF